MQITQRASPNRNMGRAGRIPDHIVIHTTGGTFTSAINTIMNPRSEVSYHFVISRMGEIVQAVAIENMAWANGTTNNGNDRDNGFSALAAVRERRQNANIFSVSIGLGDMPAGNPSPAQMDALMELIKHIRSEVKRIYNFEIPFDRANIVGHNEITPRTRPHCPGRAFPFDELLQRLNDLPPVAAPPSELQPPTPPARTVDLDIMGEVQTIQGYIENGATFVRLTEIVNALGFTATWDEYRRIPVVDYAGKSENRLHLNAVNQS